MVLLRSVLFAIVFYLSTAIYLVLGSWLLLAPRAWAMAGLAAHARTSVWLLKVICGVRMELRGRENLPPGPVLVAAKHQSAWDTFALVPLFADPAIVLKEELARIPLYGQFCRKFEHILVRRERAAAALKGLVADAKERAAAGREIVIFPEGTRRPPGAPPDYKPGVVALYEGLGLPCVPLALNSGLFWPRRKLMRYPGTIVVEILEPIPAGLDRKAFRRELENRVESACARLVAEAMAAPHPPPAPSSDDRALVTADATPRQEQTK